MATPPNWVAGAAASRPAKHGPEPKVLSRIRGLLAKAEATTFAEEAATLSAKAQDLMTRYAIDTAVVDAEAHTSLSDQVITRRLLVDNPYPEAKVQLLNCVADSNSVVSSGINDSASSVWSGCRSTWTCAKCCSLRCSFRLLTR